MQPPKGYQVPPGQVCRLKRSLYGLKQASRQWNQEFTDKLQTYGFIQSSHGYCLFIKDELFTIKDLGSAKYFLGLELARSAQGLILTQTKYIKDLVSDTGLSNAKATTTPLPTGIKFSADAGNPIAEPEVYRRLIGRLLYLGYSRLDILHASQQLSQFLQFPCQQHWDAAMHLVKYLKGTPYKGLFFPTDNTLSLKAYCDADWAACVDSRRSLTGSCIFFGSALISRKTKKQNTRFHAPPLKQNIGVWVLLPTN
ncbi:UNVERIFIED_CONTAM: Retrovirus-related Pol polyprotein from transposon RE1 [Sesamum latifolium]|uniref:Retrovirus-related Pol polyprotein from transposon RE1 n=1 Tax=Sesamum latifolium TaxID=2727402 RepID=A0AAW2XMC1_9LAMI